MGFIPPARRRRLECYTWGKIGSLTMPIRTAIWKVSPQPEPLVEVSLAKEQLLEDMISPMNGC